MRHLRLARPGDPPGPVGSPHSPRSTLTRLGQRYRSHVFTYNRGTWELAAITTGSFPFAYAAIARANWLESPGGRVKFKRYINRLARKLGREAKKRADAQHEKQQPTRAGGAP